MFTQEENILIYMSKLNATKEVTEHCTIIRYDVNKNGILKPALACFIGKSRKVTSNYYYNTIEKREETINNIKSNCLTRHNELIKKRKEQTEYMPTSKVGDIFVASWGFEQTNIDFYKLIDIKGKTGTFVEIGSKQVEGTMYSHGMACEVVADPTKIISEPFKKRISKGELLNLTSYKTAFKWNGSSEYCSWYA